MTGPRGLSWEGRSRSAEHTMALGCLIARAARAGDIIALVGELGSGKTQFVRGMAGGMGIDPGAVASPTFVLIHEYAPAATNESGLVLVELERE